MVVETLLRTFEDSGERIVWLPGIALAYLYNLTGWNYYLYVAPFALAAAMNFYNLNVALNESEKEYWEFMDWYYSDLKHPKSTIFFDLVYALLYVLGFFMSVYGLLMNLGQGRIVIVGLFVLYLAIGAVVIRNLITARTSG